MITVRYNRSSLKSTHRFPRRPAIIEHFNPPQSPAEAIALMDAFWEEDREELGKLIALPYVANSSDPSLVEIRDKYAGRLGE